MATDNEPLMIMGDNFKDTLAAQEVPICGKGLIVNIQGVHLTMLGEQTRRSLRVSANCSVCINRHHQSFVSITYKSSSRVADKF